MKKRRMSIMMMFALSLLIAVPSFAKTETGKNRVLLNNFVHYW